MSRDRIDSIGPDKVRSNGVTLVFSSPNPTMLDHYSELLHVACSRLALWERRDKD